MTDNVIRERNIDSVYDAKYIGKCVYCGRDVSTHMDVTREYDRIWHTSCYNNATEHYATWGKRAMGDPR